MTQQFCKTNEVMKQKLGKCFCLLKFIPKFDPYSCKNKQKMLPNKFPHILAIKSRQKICRSHEFWNESHTNLGKGSVKHLLL